MERLNNLNNTEVFESQTELLEFDLWSHNQRLRVRQKICGELYECFLDEPEKVLTPAPVLNLIVLHSDSDTTDCKMAHKILAADCLPLSRNGVNSKGL